MTYSCGSATVANSLRGISSVREFLKTFLSCWTPSFPPSWILVPCLALGFLPPWWVWPPCCLELWEGFDFDWFTFVLCKFVFAFEDWFELFVCLDWGTLLAGGGPFVWGGKDDLTLTFGWFCDGFRLILDLILDAVDKSGKQKYNQNWQELTCVKQEIQQCIKSVWVAHHIFDIFTKGNNFYDFWFVSLRKPFQNEAYSERKNLLPEKQILFFQS